MSTITVTIQDDRFLKLQELAARFKITPEDLVQASIEELLTGSDEAFQRAAQRVLDKNSELYRRLTS
jgi:predicted transcriptional regulator